MRAIYAQRPYALTFLLLSFALWGSVSIRWITEFIEQNHPLTGLISVMLLGFGILLGLEPWLTRGVLWRAHAYLSFQAALVFIASLFFYELDFFALLYLPLCGQAMFILERRIGMRWMGILIILTVVGQMIQFGSLGAGLSFILLYTGGLLFVGSFSGLTLQAEDSRVRSEELLAELKIAHEQLQEFSGKIEELAVAKERNRLARDLHDSVAQTLYGLTLQSEAASRQLTAGKLDVTQRYLQEIQDSALQSLQETRLLIFELRPPLLEEVGLASAIKARLEAVEMRSGLEVELDLDNAVSLSEEQEIYLYRIAQEALNNILKHAHAHRIVVSLKRDEVKNVHLIIQDDGVGYTSTEVQGGLGLQSIKERVDYLGGTVSMESEPGRGTVVNVEVPL